MEQSDPLEDGDPHTCTQNEHEETANAFASLISAIGPPKTRPSISKFVKKLDNIPEISLPLSLPRCAALSLAD